MQRSTTAVMGLFVDPTLGLDADRPELRLFVYHIIYTLLFLSISTLGWSIAFVGLGSVSQSSSLALVTALLPFTMYAILYFIHHRQWFRDLSVSISLIERRILILGNMLTLLIMGACAMTAIDTGLYQSNPQVCMAIAPIFTILLTGSQRAAMFWGLFGALHQIMYGALWHSGHRFDSAWVDPRPSYSIQVAVSDAILLYIFSLVIGLTTAAFVNETVHQTQQKAEYLRTALKRQHRFLAQTAHEIRTPLMHASNVVELLSEACDDSSIADRSVEWKELTPLLRRAIENVVLLVSNVLDLEQILSKSLKLEHIPFDVVSLIAESTKAITALNSERDPPLPAPVEMAVIIDPDVPRMVSGDPLRIRQILHNVLDNACKFVPNITGHIQAVTIFVRFFKRTNSKVANLAIEIADNGIGIESDKLSAVFTGFHFMENLYTTGMQLGLAVAQSLARQMGGDIRVVSEGRGHGCRFVCNVAVELINTEVIEASSHAQKTHEAVYFFASVVAIGSAVRPILEKMFSTVHIHEQFRLTTKKPHASLVIADATPDTILDMERTINEAYRCPFLAIVDASHLRDCSNAVSDSIMTSVIAKPIISHIFIQAIGHALSSFGSRRTRSSTEEETTQISSVITDTEAITPKHVGGLNILLVDDIPTNLKIVGRALQSLGHIVTTAKNGLEALKLIERAQAVARGSALPGSLDHRDGTDQIVAPFNVVITDIMMPVMDGIALIKTIRERELTGRTRLPIFALTAAVTVQIKNDCLKAGADRILTKPFTKEALRDALGSITSYNLPAEQ